MVDKPKRSMQRGSAMNASLCKAHCATQCTHPETQLTGCWLFTGNDHRKPGTAVSPVFPDLAYLFQWCNKEGWKEVPGTLAGDWTFAPYPDPFEGANQERLLRFNV